MRDGASTVKAHHGIRRRSVLGLAAAAVLMQGAWADDTYPSRPVRFVVPFPPGGGADLSARFVGTEFTRITGQPVVVDNRGGGNGFIGVNAVLTAPHDGYTLLFGSNTTLATNAALFKTLPYDPLVDLQPVSLVIRSPIVFLTGTDSPYRTLGDYMDIARREPDKHMIGTGSAGYQLMAALLARKAGFSFTNVPYKSASDTVVAVVSGQIEVGVVDITSAMPLIRSGRARALAIASDRRNPGLPDVPTAAEAGVSGYTAAPWNGLAAPRGVPPEVMTRLSEVFTRIMALPQTQAFFADQYVEVMKGGQAEMRAYQREEVSKWKQIAVDAKIEMQ